MTEDKKRFTDTDLRYLTIKKRKDLKEKGGTDERKD